VKTRDTDLIRQVQAGDAEAFSLLVNRHRAPLYHSIRKLLGDADAAADVTQQAFISVFEHIDDFDPDHRLFSWLYRIAYNGALNRISRRKHLRPLANLDFPSSRPSPAARLEIRERNTCLRDAIGALAYKYRVLMVLRHFLDFSYAEIAAIVDLPTTTVRSRIHTARSLLKKEMEARGVHAAG
jgi:RNA polymerase sigma-70 factor (ECF subfamily)